MNRLIQPELLDELPPDDPRARWSRRDLRRINAWMRNPAIMANALQSAADGYLPEQITDLGSGDGNFLLRVARVVSGNGAPVSDPAWHDSVETCRTGGRCSATSGGVKAILVDRQKNVTSQTLASFASLGWQAEAVAADVFDWVRHRERRLPAGGLPGDEFEGRQDAGAPEVVVANLFLHHFEDPRLVELFRAIAGQARLFVAIEPRRSPWTAFWCRLLWAIGCNSVTRHDAAISVRAGFSGCELSALWPADPGWELTERRTGFFSHLFVARKVSPLKCADMSALSK